MAEYILPNMYFLNKMLCAITMTIAILENKLNRKCVHVLTCFQSNNDVRCSNADDDAHNGTGCYTDNNERFQATAISM